MIDASDSGIDEIICYLLASQPIIVSGYSIFNVIMNIITEIGKIPVHISVGISQNKNTKAIHIGISFAVSFGMRELKMQSAIKLYNNSCFSDVEVSDIFSKYFLAVNRQRQIFEIVIPKVLFFRGHLFPQRLRESGQ